ncbi:MAG TPA: hypothetical protein VE547_17130 [Mycobacteriales bacterium]|jgi:hypothetical protein|nr:hypothetical protein [Mycobacteriales bacterium]
MSRRTGLFALLVAPLVLLSGSPVAAAPAAPAAPAAAAAGTAPGSRPVPEDPAPTGPECTTTPSTTQPGYSVADPRCVFTGAAYTGARFAPLTDAAGRPLSRVFTGIVRGAAYRIEVPLRWNGQLALYSHGYRGTGTTVHVDEPGLRRYQVEHGFAWAASSYATNGYDAGQGVKDTHALIALFRGKVRKPRAVYATGPSMGGHVTAAMVERFHGDFAGALPYCGVLGDKELFDYFLDANVTAAALTGTAIDFPDSLEAGQAYAPVYRGLVQAQLPQLGSGFVAGNPAGVSLTPLGRAWAGTVQQRSGGTRPGFGSAFAFWSSFGFAPLTDVPFLFGVYPGLTGGTIGVAPGNVTDNRRTTYRIEDRYGPLTPAEQALNAAVLRVAPTARPSLGLTGIPKVSGDPRIPVLSLHDLGDLFVPFKMEQVYAKRVAGHRQSRLFVSRAIRGVGHCDFTQTELQRAFADLVSWVKTGKRPAGDPILDPRAVARPTFGCRFTDPTPGAHLGFVAEQACPAG